MSLNRRVRDALYQSFQTIDAVYADALADLNLTPQQFRVLDCIEQRPESSQTDLVNLTQIDRSTMADVVRRLEARDLVKRVRSRADMRAYRVTLSPAGTRLLGKARMVVKLIEERFPVKLRESVIDVVDDFAATVEHSQISTLTGNSRKGGVRAAA